MARPVILIVEDSPDVGRAYERRLQGCDCIIARSIAEARASFHEHQWAIDVVIMDGEVPGAETTEDLVRQMRGAGYNGPLIAASGQPSLNTKLQHAGCSHAIDGHKNAATIKIVTEILRSRGTLPPQSSGEKRRRKR